MSYFGLFVSYCVFGYIYSNEKVLFGAHNTNDMQRALLQDLIQWKNREDRKPLIIRGARQVGKTWIMKEFGKTH